MLSSSHAEIMQFNKSLALIVAAVVAGVMAEVQAPAKEAAEAKVAADIGCYQQGTPRKPAVCAKPNCPGGYRSVFWDWGCPDGSWKCCI
jgi:hypothetical protein